MTPGLAAFKLAFQLSPIFLTGGVARFIPGGVLPVLLLTEAINLPLGLLSGGENIELDDFFAHYQPLPGGTLIDNQFSMYPFANQTVAANAQIQSPLQVSMRMVCPARNTLGYAAKLATMMLLQQTFSQHNRAGGTYTVATPSYFYTNCLMTSMRDITGGETKQVQAVWQLDFMQPLLTVEEAEQVQGSLMNRITSGVQIDGTPAWSGADTQVGQLSPSGALQPGLAGGQVITPQPGNAVVAGLAPI